MDRLSGPTLILPLALPLPLACNGDDDSASASESASSVTATAPTTSPSTTDDSSSNSNSNSNSNSGSTSSGSVSESATGSTGTTASETSTSSTTAAPTTGTSTTDATTTTATTGTTGEPIDVCKVNEGGDMGMCSESAPPNAFEPDVQWTWTAPNEPYSIVTPLVANLTDDDNNGEIDLCDTPDVVVLASTSSGFPNAIGHIYVLDGETGTLHFQIATDLDHTVTPAIGDIDGDGLPEIVASVLGGSPIAFEHDGTLKWQSATPWPAAYSGAIALADLDNDGDIEIIAGNQLYDHNGVHLWTAPQPAGNWSATAAADLDGDGDLEVVLGHAAYHHDGSQYYLAQIQPGYPAIADLDDDGKPEILVTNALGLSMLEHDGSIKFSDLRPTGDPPNGTTWLRPATVHDFDGDESANFAVSSANNYTVYDGDASIVWKATVSDQSGIAAGTAFDFLGDGTAEAMYADENFMFVFDGAGSVLLKNPRTSGTLSEYPIVADIDNDGSAEIVFVSNQYLNNPASPTVQVIRDKEDRWIQARRIWNQHTYHVTNVREDGTIPAFEIPHWEQLNTFRTNAQIESGGVCMPIPQ